MRHLTKLTRSSGIALVGLFWVTGAILANEFSYPPGVYNGEAVEHTALENGGKVNKAFLEKLALTMTMEPEIVKVTDGVWTLAGYYYVYPTIIEGDTGWIIFDTGDDIKEGAGILELARQVSDQPVSAIICSHAHYVFGARPLVEAGKNVEVFGHPPICCDSGQGGGLGSAIPEFVSEPASPHAGAVFCIAS